MSVLALCLAVLALMITLAFGIKKSEKNKDALLSEKMEAYLINLQKQFKEGKIEEHVYKKEDQQVRNFLFQMFKSNQQ